MVTSKMTDQPRFKGRFEKKSKAEWREKLRLAAKNRKKNHEKKTFTVIGSRMCDISLLADELWCKKCNLPLSFRDIEKEIKIGLASIFSIKCRKCQFIHKVRTSSFTKKCLKDDQKPQCAIAIKTTAVATDERLKGSNLNMELSECNFPTIQNSSHDQPKIVIKKEQDEVVDEKGQRIIKEEKRLVLAIQLSVFNDRTSSSEKGINNAN